ncbi:MAG: hypothetical protein HOV80_18550 [Polyangiaceae bacterium]|nr:hypothetical protein [Polyangiaceae bacterium]
MKLLYSVDAKAVGVERGTDRVNRPHTLWVSTFGLIVAVVSCSDDEPRSTTATGSDGTGAGSATTGSGGNGGGGTTGTMQPPDGGGGNGGNGGGAGGNICEGSDAPECPEGIESCGTPDLPECPSYAFCITCCCVLQAAN